MIKKIDKRYPKIGIKYKMGLAKALSNKKMSVGKVLSLIDDVLANHEKYWKDNTNPKLTKPEEGKFCRSARGSKLGRLLGLIDTQILAPYDKNVPSFIFGGISGRDSVMGANYLLGYRKNRTLLKMDMKSFFEHVLEDRVIRLFMGKCGCSKSVAEIIAKICCVPIGPKSSPGNVRTIARGFATSPRLAIWCNLGLFLKVRDLAQKELRGRDVRVAIYVDDIGITASRVTKDVMWELADKIKERIFLKEQSQVLNDRKTDVWSSEERPEHLGNRLLRGRLAIGSKSLAKKMKLESDLHESSIPAEKRRIRRQLEGINMHKRHVESSRFNKVMT